SEVRHTPPQPLIRTSDARGAGRRMTLVPLLDLKFLTEFAATAVGTFKSAALDRSARPPRAVVRCQRAARPPPPVARPLPAAGNSGRAQAPCRERPQLWRT